MRIKEYYSVSEFAEILGISRIAVYKRIKKGQIEAVRFGRSFAIPKKYILEIIGENLSEREKKIIEEAVEKTFKEYGEVLKRLGST